MHLIEDLINIVAPHTCVGCQAEGSLLCYECIKNVPFIPPRCYVCRRWSDDFVTCRACRRKAPIHRLVTAMRYEGAAKDLLHKLKFGRAQAGADLIAEILSSRITDPGASVITFVPTASSRVRERGYDQAELIAKALAVRLSLPCLPLLARVGSQRQVGQRRAARQQQMAGAFRPRGASALQSQHLLLVDDVLTTGSTCEAAARVLRTAGAKRVSAVVFAVA